MSDPYIDALERFRESVDSLKTEQGKDLTVIRERLAVVETIPREIRECKDRIGKLEGARLTKEEVATVVQLAIANERLRADSEERLKPKNETRMMRSREKGDRLKFWAAIIGSLVIFGSAALSAYSMIQVARISATKESKP